MTQLPLVPLSTKKKALFSSVVFLISYAVAEMVCAAVLPSSAGLTGATTFAIQEDIDGFQFDPVNGYRVPKGPVRFARATDGQIEYIGRFVGNAQGFQGEEDFTIHKPSGVTSRAFVFGDSFTSAAFLKDRWTDRAHDKRPEMQLYNVAIDGAGLANWWSVLTRLVLRDGYDFDSVIFSLIPNDLDRPFVVADYRRDVSLMLGYGVWSHASFDVDSKRGFHLLNQLTLLKVNPGEFDASLRYGQLCRGTEPSLWHLPIASRLVREASQLIPPAPKEPPPCVPASEVPSVRQCPGNEYFNAEQVSLILDIRDRLAALHKPILVIDIPGRDELLAHRDESLRVRKFAELLGARFIDGTKPFRKLDDAAIRASYFPHDGHWNQAGSDRFFRFVANKLK